MRRTKITLLTLLAMASITLCVAYAQNPHFINASASGPDEDGNLLVKFKIAGLGDAATTTVRATADATAIYACQNRGKKCPNAANKQEVTQPIFASGQFTSGKNGQITNSLTLTPPQPTLSCPPGQELILVAVTYRNVRVSETSAGTRSIDGTFSRTFVSGDCAALFGL